ncbi:MAG: DUF4198 domain-containing protein [Candidatus Solibacter sp.]|nr:DUF4198 domain-containing protein [Candidatus Solibacter sp.]
MPAISSAHRQWMLPSSTVLSNTDAWVTVDAAVSNGLFYFDHVPMRLASVRITGPDGLERKAQNAATGKYRSTFDVHLNGAGTYKIAMVQSTVFAAWEEAGQQKTWRGSAADLAAHAPAGAQGLKTSRMNSRLETFVTAGKPSSKVFETTGVGLELAPVTHPNDLVTGEAATFQMLLDGKPAAGLDVTIIAGGSRYRDKEGEMKVKTGADGKFSVTFKDPGMYWMNATAAQAGGEGPAAGGRSSYTATFEVLPQ